MAVVQNLKFAIQYLTGIGVRDCDHVTQIDDIATPPKLECPDCATQGASWVHLRMCMTCGYVGCCDSSSQEHMRTHAEATNHPIACSIEPGETWQWCYPHRRLIRRR